MKKMKNIIYGSFFVLAAILIFMDNMGWLGNIGGFTIVITLFLIAWFGKSIFTLKWGGIFFSLAFLAVLYDEKLGIEKITPIPILVVAMLVSIGFNMIFKTNKTTINFQGWSIRQKVDPANKREEYFSCQLALGAGMEQVDCRNLKLAEVNHFIGNLMIYMDSATLFTQGAYVKIKNFYGKTTLYVSRDWNVQVNMKHRLGGVTTIGEPSGLSLGNLTITGKSVFGEVEIVYV